MTTQRPLEAAQKWLNEWLSAWHRPPLFDPSTVLSSAPPPSVPEPAAKPRRKGLGPKQLKWLRTNIEPFKDMESRAKAAKGAIVGKK